jgi:hypothetical protein
MELILKLSPEVATAQRSRGESEPDVLLKSLNLRLRPMHPNRATGPLSTYFSVDAPEELVEMLRTRLPQLVGVESAYPAPAPEPPRTE